MKKTSNFQQLITSVNGKASSGLVGHSIAIGDGDVQVVISGATREQLQQFCAAYYIGNGDELQIDFDKTQETVIFDRGVCGDRVTGGLPDVSSGSPMPPVKPVPPPTEMPRGLKECGMCKTHYHDGMIECPRCEAEANE